MPSDAFHPDRITPHRLAVRPAGATGPWRTLEVDATARHLAAALAEAEGYDVRERRPDADATDPRPGRVECERCGYDLEGTVVREGGLTCPECGTLRSLSFSREWIRRDRVEAVSGAVGCLALAGGVALALGVTIVLFVLFYMVL